MAVFAFRNRFHETRTRIGHGLQGNDRLTNVFGDSTKLLV